MFAYVHDLDPVIFDIWRMVKLRWYGMAYLMAFVAAYFLLRHLSRKNLWVVAEKNIGDFIALLAMVGVFLGGRLGYVFFYEIPEHGWRILAEDPLMPLKVYDGGMASHGGFLGVALFTLYYARKHKLSWTGIGDGICIVAPLGLMFGRIANFINGELFGRVATDVPWAVKFPQALDHESAATQDNILNACAMQIPEVSIANAQQFADAVRHNPAIKQIADEFITPRHPSQLYEGALEGLVLFVLMWFLRFRYPKAPHGMICGIFFILYALFRTFVEQYREPDASRIMNLTKGQFYSLFMIIAGIGFLWHAWKQLKQRGEIK